MRDSLTRPTFVGTPLATLAEVADPLRSLRDRGRVRYFPLDGDLSSLSEGEPGVPVTTASMRLMPDFAHGLAVEAGTTNLFGTGQQQFTTGWGKISGSTVTVAQGVSLPEVGRTDGTRVTFSGPDGRGDGLRIYTEGYVSTAFTYSLWVRNESPHMLRFVARGGPDTTVGPYETKRCVITNGGYSGVNALHVGTTPGANVTASFVAWDVQAEALAYPTAYTPTTRPAPALSAGVPLNPAQGTVACWVTVPYAAPGGESQFLSLSAPGSPFYLTRVAPGYIALWNGTGVAWGTGSGGASGFTAAVGDLVFVAVSWGPFGNRLTVFDPVAGRSYTQTIPSAGSVQAVRLGPDALHGTGGLTNPTYFGLCVTDFVLTPDEERLLATLGRLRGRRTVPPGAVTMHAGTTVPGGYLPCDGAAVSRYLYPRLFAAIGTAYGSGDGSHTFNLPDLRSRFPVGTGAATGRTTRAPGSTGGAEVVALEEMHLGPHAHLSDTATVLTGTGKDSVDALVPHTGAWQGYGYTAPAGDGVPHDNMPPFQAVTFLIRS